MFWVQDLEQGSCRIPSKISAYLVHLVHHKNGIFCACAPDFLDYPSRHGPNIGAPVTPYLRLVTNASKGKPDKFSTQGPCDRFSKRRLAHPRRPHKTEDRALDLAVEFSHCNELYDPFLYLFQVVVVLVQDLSCPFDVKFVPGGIGPW